MAAIDVGHVVTIWMVDDIPARIFFGGQRWIVTDCPTGLRDSIWSAAESGGGLYGWRFRATNDSGDAFMFDAFRGDAGWHVHRTYD